MSSMNRPSGAQAMSEQPDATTALTEADGRPTTRLPNRELIRISLYWLGLSSIFAGLIAIIVQPTIGSISDYTISRWGRRKPYIFIGSSLDVIFLIGIASSNTVIAIAAFI